MFLPKVCNYEDLTEAKGSCVAIEQSELMPTVVLDLPILQTKREMKYASIKKCGLMLNKSTLSKFSLKG